VQRSLMLESLLGKAEVLLSLESISSSLRGVEKTQMVGRATAVNTEERNTEAWLLIGVRSGRVGGRSHRLVGTSPKWCFES
jgi:hypothetical protein